MRFTIFSLALLFAASFVALETFSQTSEDTIDKETVVSDSDTPIVDNKTEEPTQETLKHVPSQSVQYCQGKYNKKGIGGVEIITVQCPQVTDTCNCEVNKKNLRERVNCGGVVKNSSEQSELISCDSRIIGK